MADAGSASGCRSGSVLLTRGLSRSFGVGSTRVQAVVDVDLTVERGEVVLIMGPSGSGKTTLLSLVGGLLRPSAGTVSLAGHDLAALGEAARARVRRDNVGFVFQDFNLLSALTARENVEIALNLAGRSGRSAREAAYRLLDELGMGARLDFTPGQLSGGEQQRVAIARALANRPLLILADEPTANLDSRHGKAVVDLLVGITRDQGRTVVIVSHDYRLADVATRIVWMEDGRLQASAPAGVSAPFAHGSGAAADR